MIKAYTHNRRKAQATYYTGLYLGWHFFGMLIVLYNTYHIFSKL